jgi:hypothetical protein
MINEGTHLRVKTKTHKDVFGVVIYRIDKVNCECHLENKDVRDGVKLVMLGGEGKSAHQGRIIYDREGEIRKMLETKQASIIPKAEAEGIASAYNSKKITGVGPGGIQEIDI